jgi:chromosome segregation ATPase
MLSDMNEQVSSRDAHIKALEAQVVTLRTANLQTNSNSNSNGTTPSSSMSSPNSNADLEALQKKNTLLQEKLNKAVAHLKPLVEENKSLGAKLAVKESEIESLKTQISSSNTSNNSNSNNNNYGDNNTINMYAEEISQLKQENNQLQTKLTETTSNHDTLLQAKQQLEVLLSDTTSKHAHSQHRIDELSVQVSDSEKKRSQLEAELDLAKTQLDDLEEQCHESMATIESLEMQLKDFKTSAATAEHDQYQQNSTGKTKSDRELELEAAVLEGEESLRRVRGELTALQDKLQKSSMALEGMERDHQSALEALILEKDAELDELNKRLAESLANKSSHQRKLETLILDKDAELDELNKRLAESLEKKSSHQCELETLILDKDAELDELNKRLAESLENKSSHQRELETLILEKDAELDELNKRLTESLEKTSQAHTENSASLQAELDSLTKDYESLKRKAKSDLDEHHSLKSAWQATESDLQSRVSELTDALDTQTHTTETQVSEKVARALESRNAQVVLEMQELRERFDGESRAALMKYQGDLERLEGEIQQRDELISQLQGLQNAQSSDQEHRVRLLQEERVALETQLEDALNKMEGLQKSLEERDMESTLLKQEGLQYIQERDEMERRVQELSEELNVARASIDESQGLSSEVLESLVAHLALAVEPNQAELLQVPENLESQVPELSELLVRVWNTILSLRTRVNQLESEQPDADNMKTGTF